jgi:hypothetical protein
MSERTPVAVEACFDVEGTITPLAVVKSGRRRAIAAVGRAWAEAGARGERRCYFDVQMEGGETAILYLERRSLRWYIVGPWGRLKMA